MSLDTAGGTDAAMEHLIGLGHRRIGHLGFAVPYPTFQIRTARWRAALERVGVEPATELTAGSGFDFDAAGEAAGELLDLADPPTAIICDDDILAGGVYLAARERGLRIPEDVSVVGFDDLDFARVLSPPLTTIARRRRAARRRRVRPARRADRGRGGRGRACSPSSCSCASRRPRRRCLAPPRAVRRPLKSCVIRITLIRMTYLHIPHPLGSPSRRSLVLALVAGFVFQASGQTERPVRFAVVVDTSAGPAPERVAGRDRRRPPRRAAHPAPRASCA